MSRSYTVREMTTSDKMMMELLGKNGVATREQINAFCRENDHRIDAMEGHKGYIEVIRLGVYGQQRDCVILSRLGKQYLRNQGYEKFTVRNNQQIEHDLRLTQMYIDLNTKFTSWQPESVVRDRIKSETGQEKIKSCIDAQVEMSREQFIEMFYGPESDQYTMYNFMPDINSIPAMVLVGIEQIGKGYSDQDKADKVDLASENFAGLIMAERG